ncbi:galactose-specific lectin nattectin-like [Haliotis rubra]|uniref:galactose-specific lectin nattectin-like n=1 Tax=Haliotis rubra TaxID=36100 RepID=UPI001EE5F9D9|nr:galactose-specific lectin nattectin-like [Haliotis rubra]
MAAVLGMTLLFRDLFLTSLLTGEWVTSRLDCVSKCYWQMNCSSLFYSVHAQKCWLVPDVYGDSQMDAVPDGMMYFAWSHVTCDNGYTWNRRLNLCYKLDKTQVTWNLAATTCETDNGHLIRVDNADKNEFLTTLAETKGKHIWMDGSDEQQDGIWVWSNGSKINQYFWDINQPAVGDTIQNCLMIRSSGEVNRRWHDARCTTQLAFVCQLPMSENVSNCW